MSFIDRFRAAIKGGGGVRVPLARGFTSSFAMGFEGRSARPGFEFSRSVRQAFLENPVAQRAVRIIAEGIGNAPLAETDPHLLKLVRATSAGQSLLETLGAQLLLHGNGYVQVARDAKGAPIELFALRPERVSVMPGADGWPEHFRYKVGETIIDLPVIDEDGWPNIIHLKAYHPADDHYGAGCLAAAEQSVAIHNAAA